MARRLVAESIGLVFAARVPGEELAGLPELVVDGLQEAGARALLDAALGVGGGGAGPGPAGQAEAVGVARADELGPVPDHPVGQGPLGVVEVPGRAQAVGQVAELGSVGGAGRQVGREREQRGG